MARKVKYDFNPLGEAFANIRLRGSKKEKAMRAVSNFVVEKVLQRVADTESPVSGQRAFRALSEEYEERKDAEGFTPDPNLEAEGDLLDSLDVVRLNDSTLRLTVGSSQQPKADGHNNFSGKSRLPRRAFIPDENRGETFKRDIVDGIRRIVRRIAEEDE